MRRAESDLHFKMKRAAVMWAYNRGYRMLAAEFDVPRIGVVDLFGYNDRNRERAVFEAKATRSDFLKDFQTEEKVMARADALDDELQGIDDLMRAGTARVKARLEEKVAELGPEKGSRFADALRFVDTSTWHIYFRFPLRSDPVISDLYREHENLLERRRKVLRKRQRALKRGSKGRQALDSGKAERLYVVAPPGVVLPGEAPGWGVLEVIDPPGKPGDPDFVVTSITGAKKQKCPKISDEERTHLAFRLAARNQMELFSVMGVSWTIHGPVPPEKAKSWLEGGEGC